MAADGSCRLLGPKCGLRACNDWVHSSLDDFVSLAVALTMDQCFLVCLTINVQKPCRWNGTHSYQWLHLVDCKLTGSGSEKSRKRIGCFSRTNPLSSRDSRPPILRVIFLLFILFLGILFPSSLGSRSEGLDRCRRRLGNPMTESCPDTKHTGAFIFILSHS